MMNIARRIRIVIAICTVAFPALAQHPNLDRGISADKMYQFGNIDQINIFNGNLSLSIPIGGDRPVSDRLSYGLTLSYNSKVWETEVVFPLLPDDPTPYYRKKPLTLPNVGLGWMLSLGQLLDPQQSFDNSANTVQGWRYAGFDGSVHDFFGTLHDTDAVTSSLYSRDNTYLRLTPSVSSNTDCITPSAVNCLLEFPNGLVHEFEPYDTLSGRRWRVHQLRDRFGNHVDVSYSASQWQLTDQYNRVTTVHLRTLSDDPNFSEIQANYQTVVDSVDVPAFHGVDGQVAPSTIAHYAFNYAVKWIPRGFCSEIDFAAPDSTFVRVPVLVSVTLPDGTSYAMDYSALYDTNNGIPNGDICLAGEITKLTLPTVGEVRWTYQEYQLPARGCDPVNVSSGVMTRTLHDQVAGDATWTYTPRPSNEPSTQWQCAPHQITFGPLPSEELQNLVTAPSGDQTIHYFSVWPLTTLPPDSGFTRLEYGLPLTHKVAANNGKYLSTQICSGQCSTGSPKRTSYLRYERDFVQFGAPSTQFDANRRLVATRTVFNDDTDNAIDSDSTDFDGVGHYRTTTQSGTFTGTGGSRATTVPYNTRDTAINNDASVVTTGTYAPENGANNATTFQIPLTTTPWVLDLFPRRTVTESGLSATQQFCFTPANGFLRGTRILAASAPCDQTTTSPPCGDLVASYSSSTDSSINGGALGNVTTEQFFGGDATPLSNQGTTLCGIVDNPGTATYDLRNTYGYGVKKTSQYYSGGIAMSFKIFDADIDGNTGLAFRSRDTAGVQTTYAYDTSRRLTSQERPGMTTIAYSYTNATNATQPTPAKVKAEQISSTAGTARYEVEFDFLGRKSLEKRLMPYNDNCPADCISSRRTSYNGMGWVTSVSEWQTGTIGYPSSINCSSSSPSPANATVFCGFDPFGRASTVLKADAKQMTNSFKGAREITRTVGVRTSLSTPVETDATTTEHYDIHGRLFEVIEPDQNSTATYTYDVANRLARVDVSSSGLTTQTRLFAYDQRGFLLSETHPETGTTTYGSYDARGHVGTRRLPTNDIFDLNYFYDSAERLTTVKSRHDPTSATFRDSKAFHFAEDNDYSTSPNNLKRGKLDTATRYNYNNISSGTTKVTETFSYKDVAGRLTDKNTQIIDMPWTNMSLSLSYTYNDLDLLSKITYPTCDADPGCGQPTWGDVQPAYRNGALYTIPGFATAITYAPSGTVNVVTHAKNGGTADGIKDTYEPDLNALARPRSIAFSPYTACTPPLSPSITVTPSNQILYGGSASLSATAGGTAPFTYFWFQGSATTPFQTAVSPSITVFPTQTTSYWVRVSNACGSKDSATVTVTVKPDPPAGLVATKAGTSVSVSWSSSSGADHYELQRLSNNAWLPSPIICPTQNVCSATAYLDNGVAANTTYVYQVRAVAGDGTPSDPSNRDLATMMTFASVGTGTAIASDPLNEVLAAINTIRAASGTLPPIDASYFQGGASFAPDHGRIVYANHIMTLRFYMDDALSRVGITPWGYTDPNLVAGATPRAVHVTDLQGRAQ